MLTSPLLLLIKENFGTLTLRLAVCLYLFVHLSKYNFLHKFMKREKKIFFFYLINFNLTINLIKVIRCYSSTRKKTHEWTMERERESEKER